MRRVALLSLFLIGEPSSHASGGADTRGIVLITVDCGRRDHFSCYGYVRPTTPVIDAIAKKSSRFDDAVTSGVGTPSALSALFTSRHPLFADGAEGRWDALWGMERFLEPGDTNYGIPRPLVPLAEYLQMNGFATGGFAPNPYLFSELGFGRGFDQYDNFRDIEWNAYPTAPIVLGRALEWLDKNHRGRFFLFAHFMDAHAPWRGGTVRGDPFFRPRPGVDPARVSSAYIGEGAREAKRATLRDAIDLYDDGLWTIDAQVGILMGYLRETGLADGTAVFVMSDHGEELMEHGDTFHRGTVFEELLRIPLIIDIPGDPYLDTCGMARTIDVYPTIVDLVGLLPPDGLEGVSLFSPSRQPDAYVETRKYRALRTGTLKLIVERETGRCTLYDLASDPRESRDIISEEPVITREIRSRMEWYRLSLTPGAATAGADPAISGTLTNSR